MLFTCIKLANLGGPSLYLVVETDGWQLHNDAFKKTFLFNEVYSIMIVATVTKVQGIIQELAQQQCELLH